jgi:N-acetylmuramoyl-L-alanine amidase
MNRPAPRFVRRLRLLLPVLLVPLVLGLVATAATPTFIRVKRGDTLWDLSREYGSSISVLRRLNHLPGDRIYIGQVLRLHASAPPPRHAATPAGRTRTVWYRVRRGDTVSAISQHFRVPVARIAADNRLNRSRTIYPGQPLAIRLPLPKPPARAHLAPNVRHLPGHFPGKATVRTMIRRTARDLGLDPALALAVAQQESGFQQSVISSAGAVGVMQVLPSTGRWLSAEVIGRRLNLADTRDNIIAGVALLRLLTRSAPVPQAIAGYYQGLSSVRRNGMYPQTRQYVRSVLALRQRWR